MQRNLTAGEEVAGYRIEAFVAKGGMAVVYCARDTELDRRVALKVMAAELAEDESFRRRFVRESQLAASIEHPNIIPIYEAGQVDNLLYLAMRYVDGMDLRELLAREGPLGLERVLTLFGQVGDALDAAHSRGLVHRDVKPGNILVASGSGREDADHVYLTDFGLTKRASSLSALTAIGYVVGTIDYIAPEQVTGQPVDGRSDIYALGCVLYEAFTGRRPFEREIDAATLYAHVSEPPPAVTAARPDLPAGVDRVIGKAMAKNPADRYPTCRALIADLRGVHLVVKPASDPLFNQGVRGHREATPLIPSPSPSPPISGPTLRPAEPQPAPEASPAVQRRRLRFRTLAVGVVALLVAALGAVVAVRMLDQPEVTLQFPVERYADGGPEVYRTWTLTGSDGNELRGELLVVTQKAGQFQIDEVIPDSMTLGGGQIEAVVDGEVRISPGALSFDGEAAPGARQTFAYELKVPDGPVTVRRLHEWAVEQSKEATSYREDANIAHPLMVGRLMLDPSMLELTEGGDPQSLTVSGFFRGGKEATAGDLPRPSYESGDSGIATVDGQGLQVMVRPVSEGETSVTVFLGSLSDNVSVVVDRGGGGS